MLNQKKTRQRLSFNLNDDEIAVLAKRFGVDPSDKRAVKQKVADILITHTKNKG
jgi:hypothetical protein